MKATLATIPAPLQPVIKAYLLGLLSSTSPKALGILLALVRHKICIAKASRQLHSLYTQSISLHRFPAFCAVLVGGTSLLQGPIINFLARVDGGLGVRNAQRLGRFLTALLAALLSFWLLNGDKSVSSLASAVPAESRASVDSTGNSQPRRNSRDVDRNSVPVEIEVSQRNRHVNERGVSATVLPTELIAGRSIDLTLFAFIRALDVLFSSPAPTRRRKTPTIPWTTIFFTLSSATVMHAWFYSPSRLPRTYNIWISKAAQLDPRVSEALRRCRRGEWLYGRETGQGSLLGSAAEEEGLPYECGDPATTIPVDCAIVNRSILLSPGLSKSSLFRRLADRFIQGRCGCEKHALMRFLQGWYFAALMYFPLQFLVLAKRLHSLRHQKADRLRLYLRETVKALLSGARSASFLGAFIALVYYGVCLGRTRVGPRALTALTKVSSLGLLFGDGAAKMDDSQRHRMVSRMLDAGLAPTLGCFLCGLSILVEEQKRRMEIMLFVAPRAVGAWVPRRYHRKYLWREHTVFALSAATILTAVQEQPSRVRGVFGRVLGDVLRSN